MKKIKQKTQKTIIFSDKGYEGAIVHKVNGWLYVRFSISKKDYAQYHEVKFNSKEDFFAFKQLIDELNNLITGQ